MFRIGTDEDNWEFYYDTHILSNNRKIRIEFNAYYEEFKFNPIYYYNVCLAIRHKRKTNVFGKQTGKCGLEGLLWAKNKIVEFESFIKDEYPNIKIKIHVHWSDSKRRKVYERSLSKMGYVYERVEGQKRLVKTI